jgi:hypothetical protein
MNKVLERRRAGEKSDNKMEKAKKAENIHSTLFLDSILMIGGARPARDL